MARRGENTTECPVCSTRLAGGANWSGGDRGEFRCPRCGTFEISGTAVAMLPSSLQEDPRRIATLSYWVRRNQQNDKPTMITSEVLANILATGDLPSAVEQCNLLVRWVGSNSPSPGAQIPADAALLKGISGAVDDRGLVFILESLQSKGLLQWGHMGNAVRLSLTLDGWSLFERLAPAPSSPSSPIAASEQERDVFLCHASEDKAAVLEPLRAAFDRAGISYWYDCAELRWGDSLIAKVNEGLRISRFVLVVLSPHFHGKPWPERELNAALNLEASSGEVKVLPLLCGTVEERDSRISRLPLLNDKFHFIWTGEVAPIVEALKERLSA